MRDIFTFDWPVGRCMGTVLVKIIDVQRSKPLWVAAFSRLENMNLIRAEKWTSQEKASKKTAYVLISLP